MKTHKVQKGDTLPKLAQQYYGDARKWPAIERASTLISGRGQLIYAYNPKTGEGDVLNIPDLDREVRGEYPLSDDVGADEVSLVVGGTVFRGWQGLTLTQNSDTVADGFSLSAPFNAEDPEIRKKFQPFGYQFCRLYIGKELVFKGTLEKISPAVSGAERGISVQGRSLTGAMVDCSIEGQGQEFRGQSLRTICTWVADLFGVEVKDETEDTGAIGETRPDPEDSAFQFISGLAKSKGRLLTASSNGVLAITKPGTTAGPVASIIEGQWPFLSGAGEFDGTQRYSRYVVYIDQDGTPGVRGSSDDPGVKIYRPLRISDVNSAASDANTAAAWERTIAYSSSVSQKITVSRWRTPEGKIWKKGDFVLLTAPGAMIYEETLFRVEGVTMRISEDQGRVTDLRLSLPQTYTTEMPSEYPWQ